MKTINFEIPEHVLDFYDQYRTARQGYTKIVQDFPIIYARTLLELKGTFLQRELLALFDMRKESILDAKYATAQYLITEIVDTENIEGLFSDHGIDHDDLQHVVSGLTAFQTYVFLDWIAVFWHRASGEMDIRKYIEPLC